MKKIKNNKGFALAEILAVTLVLMVIFTVLYSNFMPLSGEYAKAENYNDISSQYELHYFRKIFKEYAEQDVLGSNNYKILIGNDINECENVKNKDICNSLKDELNPTLILTKYNIKELKNELKNDTNKLDDLRTYILNLPDYSNVKNQTKENYRLIMKTKYGYATYQLDYTVIEKNLDESGANAPLLTDNMIPVYYDATNKVWKKADKENKKEEYKWYDYDDRNWANAVTIAPYEEVISNDKTNSIDIVPSGLNLSAGSYTEYGNISSTYTMSFTTSNENSSIYFDYSLPNVNWTFNLTVNGTKEISDSCRMANALSECQKLDSYTKQLTKNTTYTVELYFSMQNSWDSHSPRMAISNLTIGDNYKNLSIKNEGDYKFVKSYLYSKSYIYDTTKAKYVLITPNNTTNTSYLENAYVCSNMQNECDKMYNVSSISTDYSRGSTLKFDKYKEHTTKNTGNEILNRKLGEEIPMDRINTMWVWIPRYKYTYLKTNTPQQIKIEFEHDKESTGTIECTDTILDEVNQSQTCKDSVNGSLRPGISTYTHPAFTFGNEELKGIWVGKFVNSAVIPKTKPNKRADLPYYIDSSTILIKPNLTPLRYKPVSIVFKDARQMEQAGNGYGFPQSSKTSFNYTGELTGDSNNLDIHLMKNMEWGAALYLSQSKYGRVFEDYIAGSTIINKNPCDKTGMGLGNDQTCDNCCSNEENQYNGYTNYGTSNNKIGVGVLASTTRRIGGVYDMNGISTLTMANIMQGKYWCSDDDPGNWSQKTKPLSKYIDNYSYYYSESEEMYQSYNRFKLGDAIYEMNPSIVYDEDGDKNGTNSWYKQTTYFYTYTPCAFIQRNFYSLNGDGYNTSGSFATRSVLTITD